MRVPTVALLVLLSSLSFAGCIECDPEPVDATVTLTPRDLQVRSLPVLSSGATALAGIEVPDSHARMTFDVDIAGGPTSVRVDGLRVEVRVGDSDLPVKLHAVEAQGDWDARDGWSGDVVDGGRLTLWWGVDWKEAGPAAVVLDEGDTADVRVSFAWRVDDCLYRASGRVDHPETLPVAASLVTTTFEAAGAASLDPDGLTGAGFQVDLRVANGVRTTIKGGDALALVLPDGLATPGVAAWPAVSTFVGPLPASEVGPGETVRVTERTPTPWTGSKDGLAILVVHLRHEAADGTGGVQDDVLGFALQV